MSPSTQQPEPESSRFPRVRNEKAKRAGPNWQSANVSPPLRGASQWTKGLTLILCLGFTSYADYVSSSVSLGGYLINSKDATRDTNNDFYQLERINFSALKNNWGADVSYGYSDLYQQRPNTYANSNRLALAKLSYSPPAVPELKISAGRDFLPLLDRAVTFDGGSVDLKGWDNRVDAVIFGGYGIPNVYEDRMVDFSSQRTVGGAKIKYSPLNSLLIYWDGMVHAQREDGTYGLATTGLEVQEKLGSSSILSANSVFNFDSNAVSNAEVAWLLNVRQNDQLQIRAGMDGAVIDSTHYYDYFVNREHQYVMESYSLYWNRRLQMDLDYGLLQYRTFTGNMVDFKVNFFGCFAEIGKEFETYTNSLQLKAGYEGLFWSRYKLSLGGDYTRYDLDAQNTGLTALDFSVRPAILVRKNLEVAAEYEFLHNRIYDEDNRFYAGIRYNFYKGLSK